MAISDFTDSPNSSPLGWSNAFPDTPPAVTSAIYTIDDEKLPPNFPITQWGLQSARYYAYWNWFNGFYIGQSKEVDGEIKYRFPLQINLFRDVTRKHASVLFGEPPDSHSPLVQTGVAAKGALNGEDPSDEDHLFAKLCENLVNTVWVQSNGRAIQQEGGELTQFLGGHVFQIAYEPWHDDWLLPFVIRSWKADLFLPIWTNGDYWHLSEAYIVTRIEAAIAKNQYGIITNGALAIYIEHWTEEFYSIYIDGTPVTLVKDGVTTVYKDLVNPWHKVPFYYIPHIREGSYYGTSHVPDLSGLVREYNVAMANLGDAVSDLVGPERYIRNSSKRAPVDLPNGKKAVDLGQQNPAAHNPPDAWIAAPPSMPQGLSDYPDKKVYAQFRRSASLPSVMDGEDEGSQRSGVTLDIRFWAATSHANLERTFWETGLNLMARDLLLMIDAKKLWGSFGQSPPKKGFLVGLEIAQKWSPQIPRDREAKINEILARVNGTLMSPELALPMFGDVPNQEQELEDIKSFAEWKSEMQAKQAMQSPSNPLDSSQFSKNSSQIDKG